MNPPHEPRKYSDARWREAGITGLALSGILLHLLLRYGVGSPSGYSNIPLFITLIGGGIPLLWTLGKRLWTRDFGADLLAAIAILTSVALGQYLAGSIIVLMLSGGASLEQVAAQHASAVLEALAQRMPQVAHRKQDNGVVDIILGDIAVGDILLVLPQEICPADGTVMEGYGTMDESYLTGEPFEIEKAPGSPVLSGAINQNAALVIRAEKRAVDSRYAKIMQVLRAAEQDRPRLRRIGDRLGAWYAPVAFLVAVFAGAWFHDPMRFLAVLVIATPCPLLIAIPVAIIGTISLAAKRAIIIKNPAVLEQISTCRTLIFDKTGTLTYGRPSLTEIVCAPGFSRDDVLRVAASLERYSKHPLAGAILRAAEKAGLLLDLVAAMSEKPGEGLEGKVAGRKIQITGRSKVMAPDQIPSATTGLECIMFIDGAFAAAFQFRDAPRQESRPFISHLSPRHEVTRILLVSGDRESEVRYLADEVGIQEVYAGQSPENKVALVRKESARQKTLFIGDGINDAPALMAATVGIAFGQNSDITSEAADAVILEPSLRKVDELFHISRRMRTVALQSALGGMVASLVGMGVAAAGHLTPVTGAILQEIIDLVAVLNAVRAAALPKQLSDCCPTS